MSFESIDFLDGRGRVLRPFYYGSGIMDKKSGPGFRQGLCRADLIIDLRP